ncbi:polysaccharide deacetylase family protein [Flavimarina sp. Hel_I_48]|uniref:polysaccharide deacetylase family protein n=1 Tax=Flavimarina sp. Hel_I_48 TaxID=1392488 RepID=UPI0004DFCDB8|nr:polysaccharide deacetylase family protein [Flavimarina sp. Hel_I_48]
MIRLPLPVKMPQIVKWIYPNYLWDKKKECKGEKILFLTFDDGPIPMVTPWVLELLRKYDAKATFFVIGENVAKHPEIFQDVLYNGHRIGNHTYNHLNGKKSELKFYWENIIKTDQKIQENIQKTAPERYLAYHKKQKLFRPPYGQLRSNQAKLLKKKGYTIVLYDVLAYDWDKSTTGNKCSKNVLNHAENGSIILFHDSLKAYENIKIALPKVLESFAREGYTFKSL